MYKALVVVATLAAGFVVGACGESGGSVDDSPPPKPKQKGDPRPRVEGSWRALYSPLDSEQAPDRTTWKIAPLCKYGACGFKAKSSGGSAFRYRFDKAIGDYRSVFKWEDDCGNAATREVVHENAYIHRAHATLEPVVAVETAGGQFATELVGTRITQSNLKPKFYEYCENGSTVQESMRLVRVDPPRGQQVSVQPGSAPPVSSAGDADPGDESVRDRNQAAIDDAGKAPDAQATAGEPAILRTLQRKLDLTADKEFGFKGNLGKNDCYVKTGAEATDFAYQDENMLYSPTNPNDLVFVQTFQGVPLVKCLQVVKDALRW
jgi:hypothetical protein